MSAIELIAALGRPSTQSRRGSIALSPANIATLGTAAGDAVLLRGDRATTAIVVSEASASDSVILLDELVLANLGVATGSPVKVEAINLPELSEVTFELSSALLSPDPELIRALLADKALTVGDKVTLLPLENDSSNAAARKRASSILGSALSSFLLKVSASDPSPGFIGARTRITIASKSSLSSPALPSMPSARFALPSFPVVNSSGDSATSVNALDELRGTLDQLSERTRAANAASAAKTRVFKNPPKDEPVRTLEDLPTLEAQVHQIEEWLDLGFNHSELLSSLGTTPQMGILVAGPRGSGKRSAVEVVASRLKKELVTLSGTRLGAIDPQAALESFATALASAENKIILITDIDQVFGKETSALSGVVVEAMAKTLASQCTAIIGTSVKLDKVSTLLRVSGLLEHSVSIPAPAKPERARILGALTKSIPLEDVNLEEVAARTPGFVAADLRSLCDAAALSAARRSRQDKADKADEAKVEMDSEASEKVSLSPVVTSADFTAALKVVKASSMDGMTLEVGQITLDDVRGVDEIKQTLTESVMWPLAYPDTFARLGVPAPRGILLYGPPGCGKTYLVKALAGEGRANIFSVKGAELLSKWVGDSEAAVRDVFRRAREASPAIIFLDEIDALAPARGNDNNGVSDRVVAALLTELDGVEDLKNVVVIGATNRPDLVDPALLRPGRLGRLVFVAPPDAPARAEILKGAASKVPFVADVNWDKLGEDTNGFSAADCSALIQEAAFAAMRADREATVVTNEHLESALKVIRPSLDEVSVAHLKSYAEARA